MAGYLYREKSQALQIKDKNWKTPYIYWWQSKTAATCAMKCRQSIAWEIWKRIPFMASFHMNDFLGLGLEKSLVGCIHLQIKSLLEDNNPLLKNGGSETNLYKMVVGLPGYTHNLLCYCVLTPVVQSIFPWPFLVIKRYRQYRAHYIFYFSNHHHSRKSKQMVGLLIPRSKKLWSIVFPFPKVTKVSKCFWNQATRMRHDEQIPSKMCVCFVNEIFLSTRIWGLCFKHGPKGTIDRTRLLSMY